MSCDGDQDQEPALKTGFRQTNWEAPLDPPVVTVVMVFHLKAFEIQRQIGRSWVLTVRERRGIVTFTDVE